MGISLITPRYVCLAPLPILTLAAARARLSSPSRGASSPTFLLLNLLLFIMGRHFLVQVVREHLRIGIHILL